jgi:hypothetical protein
MTTQPPDDPWAPTTGMPSAPPPGQPAGWGAPPGQQGMPPGPPPPGWGAPAQPGAWGQPGYAPQRRNGLGTAGLVCGIVGALLFWTVIGGVVLGVLGLIFGLVGRSRAQHGQADNGGVALAGAILGGLAIVGSIGLVVANRGAIGNEIRYRRCVDAGRDPFVCRDLYPGR